MADHILVLADETIKEQGTWDSLSATTSAQIAKIGHAEADAVDGFAGGDFAAAQTGTGALAEAIVDLSRKNGDLSLYGMALVVSMAQALADSTIQATTAKLPELAES